MTDVEQRQGGNTLQTALAQASMMLRQTSEQVVREALTQYYPDYRPSYQGRRLTLGMELYAKGYNAGLHDLKALTAEEDAFRSQPVSDNNTAVLALCRKCRGDAYVNGAPEKTFVACYQCGEAIEGAPIEELVAGWNSRQPTPDAMRIAQLESALNYTFDLMWRFHEGSYSQPRQAEIDKAVEMKTALQQGGLPVSSDAMRDIHQTTQSQPSLPLHRI